MAGIADRYTFDEFARRARQGAFTPNPGAGPSAAVTTAGGSPTRLPEQLGKQIGQIVVTDIKTRITRGVDVRGQAFRPLKHSRPRGGAQPLRDTGRLLASFTTRTEPGAVVVGTMHPGAAINNDGGVVRAKGKMLAIPLTKEALRSGGPRRFGKKKDLQFRPTRKKRVFVLGVEDKRGRFVGQFLLVDQVTIPRREFMGVSDQALAQIAEVLAVSGFQTRL